MPAELPILIFLWRVSSASGSDEEEDDSAGEVAAVREGPASRRHEQCVPKFSRMLSSEDFVLIARVA